MATLTREALVTGVIECISESLAKDQATITEKTLLISELGADSLDIMDIMFHLEEKFSINLQKEDFNFLKRLNLSDEEGIKEGLLTPVAKSKLKEWLPSLDEQKELRPADLGQYLSVASIVRMLETQQNA
ncbi:MAG: hypothetical protein A2X86_11740 [Bdellovibrionales bacterium GWA2_49_15]|nr:MAG: hypothetical protein A2X86_11740 [Bdellovibrionales bacterium GWA2_49_15]HAZ12577.1 hypothetical protein [Bdellovibrionales bacterium]